MEVKYWAPKCLLALLVAVFAAFPILTDAGSADNQGGQVPVKDAHFRFGNNLTFAGLDSRSRTGPRSNRKSGLNTAPAKSRSGDSGSIESDSRSDSVEDYVVPIRRQDPCNLRRQRGSCPDLRTRWFYNSRSGACRQFTYSGCGGNANNFVSRRSCEDFCAGGYRRGRGQREDRYK